MGQNVKRHRQKIAATVDSIILGVVDRFSREHSDYDRNKIIDEALGLWLAQEQDRQMELQFSETLSETQQQELNAWHGIQDEAARRMFSRPE